MYGSWVLLILVAVSLIPVAAVYIWFRLAKFQFSLAWFLYALLAGAAAFFPALIMQRFLNFPTSTGGSFNLFYHVFIRIAFTEEFSRLLILFGFFFISSRIKPDESSPNTLSWNAVSKGAATGLVVGLGFALLENAVYGASDTGVLLLRAVTAAPLHAACGFRVGSAAVMFRTNPVQAIMRFATAVMIHGIYNLMAAMPGNASILSVLIALSALFSSIITIQGGWNNDEKPNEF
jgi:RsiW-degrading membrane proteinase PrsW (M82 family)